MQLTKRRITLNNLFCIYFFSFMMHGGVFAQDKVTKGDSTKLYKNIESYSKKSKFTQFIYELIFKSSDKPSNKQSSQKNSLRHNLRKSYRGFEGKIIRRINISTLDPFGYSVNSEDAESQNILYTVGNKLHIRSQHITIRNLLLIHQNQIFDSLLVKESERLIRSQRFIHEVSFYVENTSLHSDSVDLFIRVLDNWSLIPKIEVSSSRLKIDLTDKNILGLGHEFQNAFTWNHTNGRHAYNTNYFIPNIRNSYINANLHYFIDEYDNFEKNIGIERPFYSPLAKWAGGIFVSQRYRRDSIFYQNSDYRPIRYKSNIQDYWLGNAMQIFPGSTENERTTNLILAGRYVRTRYALKPEQIYDTLHFYTNEDLFLFSLGISTRKYVKDKYIFNYGITEDVPVGNVYSISGGFQDKNNRSRYYFGIRYSTGDYNEWGYLSRNFEYGTFIHASKVEQGVFTMAANYFTNLFSIGNWKIRQFVKPELFFGINRFANDSLTLHEGTGLEGFNSSALTGTNRFVLSLQTQSYAPWNFLGFRFGPYINYSFGLLGDDANGFKRSRIYSQIGLGVLVKNENLVISTFQFSISFFPLIPSNGRDIFKFNSFQTTDFGFRDFEIGKPEIIPFR